MKSRQLNPLLTIDSRGFVYLRELKICRYVAERQVYEFQDYRRARRQSARVVEVKPCDLGGEFIRLSESVRI